MRTTKRWSIRKFFPGSDKHVCKNYGLGAANVSPRVPLYQWAGDSAAPLTREEEETVMNELRAGDNTHRELLVVRNLRLVVYIAKKLTAAKPPRRIW